MIKGNLDVNVEWEERPAGGYGKLLKNVLLSPGECPPYIAFFNVIELQPNSEIGFHTHQGSGEIYYFLDGEGIYNNGTKRLVHEGDLTICYDGENHGLSNSGDRVLKYLALKYTLYK